MMTLKKQIWIAFCSLPLFLLTGCWDSLELHERSFVMGIALDETEDDKLQLTAQIYKPAPGGAQSNQCGQKSYVNIPIVENTVSEAVRKIPIHLGRKAHWGHLRTILIGEKLAREKGVGEILEFFYRDHEPRITSSVMIAKGKAADCLDQQPLMELTTGQQLLQNERAANRYSQRTLEINLLKLAKQARSELGNTMLPYAFIARKDAETSASVAGLALLKAGKLVGSLSSEHVDRLKMIRDEFDNGMIQVPCPTQPDKMEVVEVISSTSTLTPVIKGDALKVSVLTKMDIALQELSCSRTDDPEKEKKFAKHFEQFLEKELQKTVAQLKKEKFDGLDLGNKLYAKDPALWKRWKNSWERRFVDSEFDFHVKIRMISSGTTRGKPMLSK
ncbi:Ger(x)C family spore germination protein [Paenibacillus ginsengihumi]|uniref:Ger(x)C family spore germination protein n=1 Tax=Paenibacillus ginsengihumi TaxID=431596 RepID=UPI0012EB6970|nr:Ger(x)C family spore germination protein [Paenibacillus ginsengihumi]